MSEASEAIVALERRHGCVEAMGRPESQRERSDQKRRARIDAGEMGTMREKNSSDWSGAELAACRKVRGSSVEKSSAYRERVRMRARGPMAMSPETALPATDTRARAEHVGDLRSSVAEDVSETARVSETWKS